MRWNWLSKQRHNREQRSSNDVRFTPGSGHSANIDKNGR